MGNTSAQAEGRKDGTKYRPLNGWTKASIKRAIQEGNLGRPSHDGLIPRFLAPDGNKCAIGCFIPADRYSRQFEAATFSVCSVYRRLADVMPLPYEAMEILRYIHDNTEDGEDPRPALLRAVDDLVASEASSAAAAS
jgi:hypothetical protein